MTKPFIAGIAFAAFFAGSATAADMSVKAPVAPPTAAVFSWTGFYVGLNAGGNWGTSHTSTVIGFVGDHFGTCGQICVDLFAPAGNPQSFKTSGFTGGIQGGYNWQFGYFVAGVEVDFQYFRSAGSTSITVPHGILAFTRTVNTSISTDWLFTARPRLGVAAGNWLFYGTGGLAVTELKASWRYSDTIGTARENASASSTKAGWVAGGGVETALPGNWLIGAEYLYVKFSGVSAAGNIIRVANDDVLRHSGTDLSANIVRARLSRKF